MNRGYIFCLTLLCLFACGESIKPPKPDNLIPRDKMASILHELFIVNSAKGVNRKLMENKGIVPEEYILNKFNIDSVQFAQSNNYYAHDIETYQSIIEDVKSQLIKQRDSLQTLEEKEKEAAKKRRDSLLKNKTPNPRINKDSIIRKLDKLEEIES